VNAEPGRPLVLLMLSGSPASGVPSIVDALCRDDGAVRVSADLVRQEMFPGLRGSSRDSAQVFEACARLVEATFATRAALVCDASDFDDDTGGQVAEAARRSGATVIAMALDRGNEQLHRRIARGDADGRSPGVSVHGRLNIDLFSTDEAVLLLKPLLDGSVPWVALHDHLETHTSLHGAARGIEAGGPLPEDTPWFDRLLRQIESDRAADVFSRWAQSTVVDSNVGRAVLDYRVLERFSAAAGTPTAGPIANAGLTHTYGYLLAGVSTQYGWKRDRWVNGGMAQALGLDRRLLSPDPPVGTLLSNLTAAVDALTTGHSPPEWLHGAEFDVVRLTERDAAANLEVQTWIFSRPNSPTSALVYTLRVNGEQFRYVTAFSVDSSYRAQMLDAATVRTGPLELKYNTAGPSPSGAPAQRFSESLGTRTLQR
jgi:hypothetical protein